MANVYRNILIQGLTDLSGDRFMNRKTRSQKIMIASKFMLDDSREYAAAKETYQAALRAATTYASFANTQEVYINKARGKGATAYSIAFTDWFGAPRVLEINIDGWTGEIGQTIRVKARDKIMVAGVSLVIRDAAENVLEMGEAVQSEVGSAWWHYTTRSHVRMTPFPSVEAIAQDLPGNRDSFIIS